MSTLVSSHWGSGIQRIGECNVRCIPLGSDVRGVGEGNIGFHCFGLRCSRSW